MAGQRVVGVEGTLEGMQTARLLGTHRVGTISLPNHQFLNPSFYRSGHTLSSRVPRWSLGMPLPHWPAPPPSRVLLTLHFPNAPRPHLQGFLGGRQGGQVRLLQRRGLRSRVLVLCWGEGDENAYSSAENPLLGTPWGIVMLFKRDSREGMVS